MSIHLDIKVDMAYALREREVKKLEFLRVIIGEFERKGRDIPDADAIPILKRMRQNADDLGNSFEVEILDGYLPEYMGEEDLKALIANIIEGGRMKGLKDIGRVMGAISKNPGPKLIDKGLASSIAKEILKA